MPTDGWSETVQLVKRLESLGYHHLWIFDHLTWQRYRDRAWHATYPWLAGVAAATERIRLGTMVSNLNIRHPAVLAKDAMTLDHISGGRLTIGLGAGGTGFDATALGQSEMTPRRRADRLTEAAEVLDGLLRGTLTNHSGDYFVLNEARVLPGCVQRPRVPLAIAAGGSRTLRTAAQFGDAWVTYGDTTYQDLSAVGTERIVRSQMSQLEDLCAGLGRNPSTIERIYLIGHTEAKPLSSVAAFEDFVGRYQELGFTDLVFHMPRPDDPVWSEPPEIVEEIARALLDR
jgi:alkanesulfonate monooxygenase SsuD/methylene tetrahydromethanopterin reductase-like flavin-dependent oxidoreductase (luciferase family)